MKSIEEYSMNALPSLQTIIYDGWILRFANGYSNRANSVNPIYGSSKGIQTKIDTCEDIFKNRGLKPVFKISPFIHPADLDTILEKRQYEIIHPTSIMYMKLDKSSSHYAKEADIKSDFNDEWLDSFCRLSNTNTSDKSTYKHLLNNLIMPGLYATLSKDNKIVGCGRAVLENKYVGLYDIHVDENHRNLGYGYNIIMNLLNAAVNQDIHNAYLQVMTDNYPAQNLYRKLGFKEIYQYHYRVCQ